MKIYFDIETYPMGEELSYSEVAIDKRLKDEAKIEKAREEAIEKEYRGRSLISWKGRVLCIGYALDNKKAQVIGGTEEQIMLAFDRVIENLSSMDRQKLVWIGYNIKEFDLPWLRQRAFKYDCKTLSSIFVHLAMGKNAYDLMIEFMYPKYPRSAKDMPSFDDACKFFGIPCKNGIDGSMVFDLVNEGKLDKVQEYCKNDAEACRKLAKALNVTTETDFIGSMA